jgi:hypothetical protein
MKKRLFYLIAAVTMLLAVSCTNQDAGKTSLEKKLNQKMSEMSEVAELGSVEYTIEKVVKASDDAEWYKLGDRKILFKCTAYLKAGIDMSKFDATKVSINEEQKSIVLTLPKAELLSFNMPPEKAVLAYEKVATFRSNFSASDRNKLLQLGEKDIREDVPNLGILADAEKNASSFFKALLGQLGFEMVTIKFE